MNIEPTFKPMVCLLGGAGFVGHHVAALLSEHGYLVRIPARRSERHRELRVLPGVEVVQAKVQDSAELRGVLRGCGAVINLIGILNETRHGQFKDVHVKLPGHIAHTCLDLGIPRLLHMSALNAGAAHARSRYLASKGEGEAVVHAAEGLTVTSFRPSVIFGPDDRFFNRFGRLLKWSCPALPLACPNTRFAPVYVGDVAHAMLIALQDTRTIGQRYDLCGPKAYPLRDLVEYTAVTLGIRRRIIGLNAGLSALQARVAGLLPGKPFTYDNYLSLQTDAVCGGGFPAVFDLTPASVESIVPLYLGHNNQRMRLDRYRHQARHSY